MSGASNGAARSGGGGRGPARVVLVGRTASHGVDSALRGDRELELVRARSPIAALGELADPIDEHSPRSVTVLVSPEAVPPERARAFADAVRRVTEHARVLMIGESSVEGFDGVLRPGDAAAMRAAVRGNGASADPAPPPPPAAKPAAQEARAPAPPAPPSAAPEGAGRITGEVMDFEALAARFPALPDPAPAAALATGRDPVAIVLAAIKRRAGLADVRFVPVGMATEENGQSPSVSVVFGGRALGRLVFTVDPKAEAPPLDRLAREADHLAAWVTLSAQHEQLKLAAFTDELTGAFNRRYFNRFLAAALDQATGARHTVSLLVFDIDNFKTYNDQYGHAAGDEILREAVRLLNAAIRATDRVCRIGGDEFAVIFHDPEGPRGPAGAPTSPRSLGDIVRRFQKQICEHRFPKLGELAPGTLTVSGGMATFPWDGRTVQQLLDRADELSLSSKRQGKNKITLGRGAEQVCRPE